MKGVEGVEHAEIEACADPQSKFVGRTEIADRIRRARRFTEQIRRIDSYLACRIDTKAMQVRQSSDQVAANEFVRIELRERKISLRFGHLLARWLVVA